MSLGPTTTAITIHYTTSPDAGALQWLSPAQTAGGKQPYLFSQGEAILTRTWVPTQDSPGIRQTYDARIVVPAPLTAVMSAEKLTPRGAGGRPMAARIRVQAGSAGPAVSHRDCDRRHRIQAVGPRSGVYAEPSVVEKAAWEFADIEKMIDAAESMGGPYRWGRYDVLVMPPSFPFGGMENPRLTFATPTVLAGDRSLASLVAHELAHSWSGNLVTNATWSDFWLNEGFTTYFENRIMETLYGPERAAMLRALDRTELHDELKELPARRQVLRHRPRRPGSGRWRHLGAVREGRALPPDRRKRVGRDRFDTWLRGYLDHFAFQSITTAQFLEYLLTTLFSKDPGSEDRLRIHAWLYEPGLPANAPVVQSAALARANTDPPESPRARRRLPSTRRAGRHRSGRNSWRTCHGRFHRIVWRISTTYALSTRGNSEVLFQWLRLAVLSHYEPAFPALETFLTSQGRMKFVVPLYRALGESAWGRPESGRTDFPRRAPHVPSVAVDAVQQALAGKR